MFGLAIAGVISANSGDSASTSSQVPNSENRTKSGETAPLLPLHNGLPTDKNTTKPNAPNSDESPTSPVTPPTQTNTLRNTEDVTPTWSEKLRVILPFLRPIDWKHTLCAVLALVTVILGMHYLF
mmetsp:Transcript_45370/g.53127  ORF Transcript_45370/g.53127 Transcript_45370/m.53127 type:complete len:125 (+) Transcript_45370:22-396(+)